MTRRSPAPSVPQVTTQSAPGRGHRRLRRVLAAPVLVVAVAAVGAVAASVASGAAAKANVSAARKAVAAYSGHPSAFPVTQPLRKALPAGTTFVYLQADDPIAALLGALLKPAVAAIGGTFTVIDAGTTASDAQAAASSALADKPAVVLVPAFVPSEFGTTLKSLTGAGIKVVGAGMVDAKPYGVQFVVGGGQFEARDGQLLADWVVANKGAKANAVFYTVPELSFTETAFQSFQTQMRKLCPSCKVRSVPISVTTIGATAPQTVVSDLQSNPSTNVAVFSTEDIADGLPAALSSAGIKVTTVGASPDPENLADIKSGGLTAGLATDLGVYTWEMVDAGARLVLGQKPPSGLLYAPSEFLGQKDITFNPSLGWTAYPNFAQRFTALWHPKAK
jgi:ribose transport system substrate-binding protein